MERYEVIVGNIGSVCKTDDREEAQKEFNEYVDMSKNYKGSRGYQEDVVVMDNHVGDIIAEFDYLASQRDKVFKIEEVYVNRIKDVMTRLNEPEAVDYDLRRNLAKILETALDNLVEEVN